MLTTLTYMVKVLKILTSHISLAMITHASVQKKAWVTAIANIPQLTVVWGCCEDKFTRAARSLPVPDSSHRHLCQSAPGLQYPSTSPAHSSASSGT